MIHLRQPSLGVSGMNVSYNGARFQRVDLLFDLVFQSYWNGGETHFSQLPSRTSAFDDQRFVHGRNLGFRFYGKRFRYNVLVKAKGTYLGLPASSISFFMNISSSDETNKIDEIIIEKLKETQSW